MSLYDRLHQRRQAALATVRQAEHAAPVAEETRPELLVLAERQDRFPFAGLDFALPSGRVRASETAIEREGESATLRIERQALPNNGTLERAFAALLARLEAKHPGLHVVRHGDRLLAGHPARVIDFQFEAARRPGHGRLVGAIVPSAGSGRQWLEIGTLFDPTHAAFADWLIDFDRMLDALARVAPAP